MDNASFITISLQQRQCLDIAIRSSPISRQLIHPKPSVCHSNAFSRMISDAMSTALQQQTSFASLVNARASTRSGSGPISARLKSSLLAKWRAGKVGPSLASDPRSDKWAPCRVLQHVACVCTYLWTPFVDCPGLFATQQRWPRLLL